MWKTFYGICQLNAKVEKLSVDQVEAMLYCDELANIIFDCDYRMGQIFSADETSLNYNITQ